MKKLSNKIKSIYTLAAILVLSLCMLLFPVSATPVSADEFSDAEKSLKIQSAHLQVTKTVNNDSEFVFMFKAIINVDAYNIITNYGQDQVKFGMLIGPTERMTNVSSYATAKNQDFVEFLNVGTPSSGAKQQVDFRQGKEYSYNAGIIYNKEKLEQMAQEKGASVSIKDAAAIDLTAIPFYTNNGTPHLILENSTGCLPRDVLAESYIKERSDEITNIPKAVVEAYVGDVNEMPGEHFICRDTGRFMSADEIGKDLQPTSAATANDLVFVAGKKYTNFSTLSFGASLLESLPKYTKTIIGVYKEDCSIDIYPVDVAERVITRFSDTTIGTDVTNSTKDYLAKAGADKYESIFTVKNGEVSFMQGTQSFQETTDRSIVFRTLNVGYNGLYVLGANIEVPSDYNYMVDSGTVFSKAQKSPTSYVANGDHGKENNATDVNRSRIVYAAPVAYAGFNGIFDGRGHYINLNERAVNGVLPPAFDATIKNTAFYGLQTNIDGGGITYHARATTFENIYAQVTKATNHDGDLNKALLMNVQDCDFKNFVADVSLVTADVMNGALPAFGSTASGIKATQDNNFTGIGVGQGVTTSGVFSFKAYPDFYYDARVNAVRTAMSSAQFTNSTGTFYIDNIELEEVERLFPNMINKDGKAVYGLYNTGADNNNKVAPLASKYDQMKDKSQASAFTGTTGVNVYAVGSSPLYIGYDYSVEQGATPPGTQLKATKTATVFVNEAPALTAGGEADVNWKVSGSNYVAPTSYKMNQIAGNMFAFAEDATYSLGEIIYRGKIYRHGEKRMAGLLGSSAAKDVLEVRFINQEGFYDVANYTEMADYVKQQTVPFDSNYWNVNNGVVAWKNPKV